MARRDLPGPDWSALGVADDPWETFEDALRRHLRRPGAVGAMRFTAPPNATGTSARCTVQITGDASQAWVTHREAGAPLCEDLVGRWSPYDPGTVARVIVGVCRDRMGLPHPELVTLRCQGFIGMDAGCLGLTTTGTLPVDDDPADADDELDTAVEVADAEDLRERFAAIVERVTGRPTVVDDDGDLVFHHVGERMHVSFSEDTPTVRMWAWVARGIRSREATAVEIARRNRDEEWTQWILVGRHVQQRTILSAGPFVPRTVQFHLERFLYTFADTRDAITRRLA